MNQQELDYVNKHLVDKYGKSLDGKPRFRLTWSTDHLEYRRSNFGQFVNGLAVAVEENVVKQVKKYSYCQDRWILEELVTVDNRPSELVGLSNLSYEPIYVFWTGEKGDYEEPTMSQIDRRVHFRLTKSLRNHPPTEEQIAADRRKVSERNQAHLRERLDDALPDLPHALVHGSAVFLDSTKRKDAISTK